MRGAWPYIIIALLSIVIGIFLRPVFVPCEECPTFQAPLVDSVGIARQLLHTDSTLQHEVTAALEAELDSLRGLIRPVNEQVADEVRIYRTLDIDRIADSLRAAPKALPEFRR